MSHVAVFNSSAKAVRIPTTPTKYLTEVLDEACIKFNVKRDLFTLKYNNKPITLSQQIRLANLPQGARLELVQASRSPTVITVALQLPASERNERKVQKFASNTSLWEVLRQFESGQEANYNFTQRGVPEMNASGASGAGRLNYEMPVVTVMPDHKECSTFVDLQKTLNQLGFDNGSALLRLSFRNSGTPLEESMAQISQYFKQSVDPTPSGAHTESSVQTVSVPDLDAVAPEATTTVAGESIRTDEAGPDPMEIDSKPPAELQLDPALPAIDGPAEKTENAPPPVSTSDPSQASAHPSSSPRKVKIFSPSTYSTPQAARQTFNEIDYVPTVEHAKSHQASLNSRSRNIRLLSDKELEEQDNAQQEKINTTAQKGGSVRVRFPDNAQIEAKISGADTAEDIYTFVADHLEYSNELFHLQHRDNSGRLVKMARDKKLLFKDLHFSPSELLTFIWNEAASSEARSSKNVLNQQARDAAEPMKVQEPVATASQVPGPEQSKAEGKKRSDMSAAEKENKLKKLMKGGMFGKKK